MLILLGAVITASFLESLTDKAREAKRNREHQGRTVLTVSLSDEDCAIVQASSVSNVLKERTIGLSYVGTRRS